MVNMRRQLLGLGVVAASSLFAINAAHALNGPTAIQIDGGPLGPLEVSGGLDGYGYFQSGANIGGSAGSNILNTNRSDGINVGSALIDLQKTSGVLQFNVEVGSTGGVTTLGERVTQTSINTYSTGPLYEGYVTIAPKGSPVTISAGQFASLEGYEGAVDWNNPVQLTTALFGVENLNSRGVQLNFTKGPINATVMYGDGYDTGVFNFLQALFTYTINSSNTLNVYYGGNLGQTGLNAKTYGSAICNYGDPACGATVGTYGPQFDNSQLVGAYYSYTVGSLNLVPEVQYQVAKADANLGLYKQTSNFGAAVFSTYTFGKSPYSLGSWVEYFDSHGSSANSATNNTWFLGPDAEAIGFAVAPTWQYKDLFARANAGYLYLLDNKSDGDTYGYGANGNGRSEFTGTLEAGLLF
jgi:Putative beta-barrel porin-2, OmpL-like. bbp2